MPFALLIVGVVLLVSSVRNTQDDLYALVKGDFTGPNNYLYWMVSILLIGAVGYIPTLKPLSRIFLVLVIVVLFVRKGGVGTNILQQFNAQAFASSSSVSSTSLSGDGLSLQQWLDSLTPNTPTGIEPPLASARPTH